MTQTDTCGTTFDLADGRTLTCGLPASHDGPVHDDGGEVWGDQLLAVPPPERPILSS